MPEIYGDAVGTLDERLTGADHVLSGAAVPLPDPLYIYGDVSLIAGTARGGDDTISIAGGSGAAFAVGDAGQILETGRGGRDRITGEVGVQNNLYGDAFSLGDSARGGNDRLAGARGNTTENLIVGDGPNLFGAAVGGSDTIVGGAGRSSNSLYGDALIMDDSAAGGDDVITGGRCASNTLRGDAEAMYGFSQGGDDTITAGTGSVSVLYGDADALFGNARGGDDVLVSRRSDDDMWGDGVLNDNAVGGADIFVFAADNGQDTIHDFETGKDKIDLSALGLSGIGDIRIRSDGEDSRIILADNNKIFVLGVTNLDASDFIFA